MKCDKVMETVYYCTGEDVPPLEHLQIALHLFFCPACAREVKRFEQCRDVLHNDFIPLAPDFEDSIMSIITSEESEAAEAPGESVYAARNGAARNGAASYGAASYGAMPGGIPTRGWVIAGFIIMVSLATAFFGFDFRKLALSEGVSFLLPVGITIGIVLTSYGALFIGSHLKELSERFGL